MILRVVSLVFLWLLWAGIVTYLLDWFINRDFPGFLQLVLGFSIVLVTAFLFNHSILFINKNLKK
jgi:hypothetical protein